MITFNEALETAKTVKQNIDTCIEYENGYVFGAKEDDNYIGGNHTPVVILKKDGKAVTMPYFICKGAGKEIKTFDV